MRQSSKLRLLYAGLPRWVARCASVGAGAYIEYRQVFIKSDTSLIFLGLWLMAVPPALWLDSLRRLTGAVADVTTGQGLSSKMPPEPQEEEPE